MQIEKGQEWLRVAELCFAESLYNSTANRAYDAMIQAAVVALEQAGVHPKGSQWSHGSVQAHFAAELIHHRKLLPRRIASYLPDALALRHQADYHERSFWHAQARCTLHWAQEFLSAILERWQNGTPS
jgi:uncharacterized protein (UPF0332 family)